ncbi:MAG: dicarboxylate/amino acid:cation symporter, partial [candidate division Zixibacteria bacterium]|nr:dicarboxylate/amino acid:cation symporter [candidate division Zixibacteria bacterium]
MSGKTGNYILIGMVLGAILGTLGGYFLGDIFIEIKFLGTIFLNALKMVVIPLIVASIIVGVSSLGDIRKLGRTSAKTLTYYLATTGFSVLIGIILVNLIRPGVGVPPIGAAVPEFIHGGGGNTIKDVFVGLIPDNIFAAASGGKILPLIVFSLVLGGVLTVIGRKGKPVIDFFVGVNSAMMKIVILIIYFAPIGVMALIGGIVAENRGSLQEIASGLGLYSLTVIIGLLIHAVIVLPLILKFFGKKDPFRYFLNMGQALATAFTTASSSATLPVTMEAVTEKNKVDSKASSFVLPLGATINMDGTALYEAVAAIFIAQIYGIDLSVGAQVIIFFTATLASIGAAAIPEAGLVMMTLVLSAVGLPLEGIGIILVIDWFLDRCRTTVNVWGDSIGAAVIGETEEIRGYRIGGSKTAKTTKRKYTKTTNKKFERSDRSKKSYDKKPSSKTRYTRDSKSREDKGYRKTKDTPRKPISKLSSYESKPAPKPTPKPIAKPAPKPAVKSASKPAIKKSAPPKAHKPYSKTNGDKLIKKKDPVQLSKKSIEKDLEKVHRQLTEKTKYKKPTGIDKDITKEPKLKTKPV